MKKTALSLLLPLVCAVAAGVVACSDLQVGEAQTTTTLELTTTTTVFVPTTATTVAETSRPNDWDKLDPAGEPQPRARHAMVYDPATQKVILFGGFNVSNTALSDVQTYDSATNTWTELSPSGPAPEARGGHAMVYDTYGQQVILFGGQTSQAGFNDTWVYDPVVESWTQLNPAGELPPARAEHAMAFDPHTRKVVVFGGYAGGSTSLDDTWVYDLATNSWTEMSFDHTQPLPSARSRHAMVYDPANDRAVLFGGFEQDGTIRDDIWTYDVTANIWKRYYARGHEIYERGDMAMVYHPGCSSIVMFGGQNGRQSGTGSVWNYPNALFAYDVTSNSWAKVISADRTPYGRSGHAMVYDSDTGTIIMFGGEDYEHGLHSGTWTLEP